MTTMTGQEMRELREDLELSITEFGRKIGYSGVPNTVKHSIRQYETGKRGIPQWIAMAARSLDEEEIKDIINACCRPAHVFDAVEVARAICNYISTGETVT